jgi:hypothetical protein
MQAGERPTPKASSLNGSTRLLHELRAKSTARYIVAHPNIGPGMGVTDVKKKDFE